MQIATCFTPAARILLRDLFDRRLGRDVLELVDDEIPYRWLANETASLYVATDADWAVFFFTETAATVAEQKLAAHMRCSAPR